MASLETLKDFVTIKNKLVVSKRSVMVNDDSVGDQVVKVLKKAGDQTVMVSKN